MGKLPKGVSEGLAKLSSIMEASVIVDPKTPIKRDENDYFEKISQPTDGREIGDRTDLNIDDLIPYARHPFKARPQSELEDLAESIRQNGILNPVLVRPHPTEEGKYEIISGHNRVMAMRIVQGGSRVTVKVPATIRYVDDATADIMMTEANLLQRQDLLPSEKALAYKMRLAAMRKKAGRPALPVNSSNEAPLVPHFTSGKVEDHIGAPMVPQYVRGKARDELSEMIGENREQIRRYVRLSYLIPELLEMVDCNKLPFRPAVEISYLERDEQAVLYEFMAEHDIRPTLKEAVEIRKRSVQGGVTEEYLIKVLSKDKRKASTAFISTTNNTIDKKNEPQAEAVKCEVNENGAKRSETVVDTIRGVVVIPISRIERLLPVNWHSMSKGELEQAIDSLFV